MTDLIKAILLVSILLGASRYGFSKQIPLTIEHHAPGAPILVGLPFPKGELYSPGHLRVIGSNGEEVPAQATEVSTWQPASPSIKWVWVFFFAGAANTYTVEYGEGISRAPITEGRIKIINRQRRGEFTEVDTGPLKFKIKKGEGGFLDLVQLDQQNNGFTDEDIIAESPGGRGSFLDLLDDAGIDPSKAVVTRTVKEKGSGPLHAILKVEGQYSYNRDDNRPSPFTIRIHVYAGQSYMKVYHTLTYTGIPDKHQPEEGQHADIATGLVKTLPENREGDPGWTQPNDQLFSTGLRLKYRLEGALKYSTSYQDGAWWETGNSQRYSTTIQPGGEVSLFQTGPKPDRIPPVPTSTGKERLEGFKAHVKAGPSLEKEAKRADGWIDISNERWGIGIGIRHFIEEYPKAIAVEGADATAYLWSPEAGPMSFARWSGERDSGMTDNFATGLTKTSELAYYFHKGGVPAEEVHRVLNYFLDPPAPHAAPSWYTQSEVFGKLSPRGQAFEEYERGVDYKMDWLIFSQHWEPWYGMFDFGDQKYFYLRDDWFRWVNNEPAIDYMLWLQFMRTGQRKYYLAAEAMSHHTMDVDNIHWPTDSKYIGDSNSATDYWEHQAQESQATPYLGIGRRHARQHWNSLLSAHVWIQGWLSSYYLTGYHRGLDVAKLTADTYTKRIWGEHGLTGRRLYLSVWNMTEIWDATKDGRYLEDLQDRVSRMICQQNGPDQYNSLVMDRYGYAQVYASQGLYKYYQMSGDEQVRTALIRHARAIRDNPPWNHEYESYLSTIHSLIVGYELTGEKSFLQEALQRAEVLKTDPLEASFEELGTQAKIAGAIEKASHLPKDQDYHEGSGMGFRIWDLTQGMRVFGWTHIYNIPWMLYWLRDGAAEAEDRVPKKK